MFSQAVRRLSTSVMRKNVSGDVHPSYLRIKEAQKHYQIDNGQLVHQRHGTMGKVLNGITGVLIFTATIQSMGLLYRFLKPLFVKK